MTRKRMIQCHRTALGGQTARYQLTRDKAEMLQTQRAAYAVCKEADLRVGLFVFLIQEI